MPKHTQKHTAPGAPLLPYNRLEATGRWLTRVLQAERDDCYVACVQLTSHDNTGSRMRPAPEGLPADELYAVVTAHALFVAEVWRAAGYRARLVCCMPLAEVEQVTVCAGQLTVVSLPRLPPRGWGPGLNPLQAVTSGPPPLFVCSAGCMDAGAARVLHAAIEAQRAMATPSVVIVRRVGMPAMAAGGGGLAGLLEAPSLPGAVVDIDDALH